MPIYEYRCADCRKLTSIFVRPGQDETSDLRKVRQLEHQSRSLALCLSPLAG